MDIWFLFFMCMIHLLCWLIHDKTYIRFVKSKILKCAFWIMFFFSSSSLSFVFVFLLQFTTTHLNIDLFLLMSVYRVYRLQSASWVREIWHFNFVCFYNSIAAFMVHGVWLRQWNSVFYLAINTITILIKKKNTIPITLYGLLNENSDFYFAL